MDNPRAHGDFYPSPPDAIRMLLDPLRLRGIIGEDHFDPVYLPRLAEPGGLILDACAGDGRLTRPLLEAGYRVQGVELYDRGHAPDLPIETGIDFLKMTPAEAGQPAGVVMNPPYGRRVDNFIHHALSLLPDGGEAHVLLRHSWMCAACRRDLLPLVRRIVVCGRLKLPPGDPEFQDKGEGGMVDYSWFTLVKGRRDDGGVRLLRVEESEAQPRTKAKSARGRALSRSSTSNTKELS
jgi:hypothetical protein